MTAVDVVVAMPGSNGLDRGGYASHCLLVGEFGRFAGRAVRRLGASRRATRTRGVEPSWRQAVAKWTVRAGAPTAPLAVDNAPRGPPRGPRPVCAPRSSTATSTRSTAYRERLAERVRADLFTCSCLRGSCDDNFKQEPWCKACREDGALWPVLRL